MWPRCALAGLCALLLMAPAAAAQPSVTLTRAAAAPGDRVVVVGHGFTRAARLRIVLAGHTLRPARGGGGRAPPPIPPTPPSPEAATLVAAGDIACRPELPETDDTCRHARTATLVESLTPDAVAVLGDTQYEHGELENFQLAYDPTWGRFKAITHPAVGNHEYEGDPQRDSANGYYDYFGAAAGEREKGYYRWALGEWTVFVLNSGAINYTRDTGLRPELPDDCWPVSCGAGSEQEQWLRTELGTLSATACVLAYWHHPRFSSGFGGRRQPHPETEPLFGALELTLASGSWSSRFLTEDGSLVDQAAGGC